MKSYEKLIFNVLHTCSLIIFTWLNAGKVPVNLAVAWCEATGREREGFGEQTFVSAGCEHNHTWMHLQDLLFGHGQLHTAIRQVRSQLNFQVE